MSTNNEIFKQLLELAENEEQVRYLTATNDTIKDGKIEALQSDIGLVQRQLMDAKVQKIAAEDMTIKIIDRLIQKATRYDSDCC